MPLIKLMTHYRFLRFFGVDIAPNNQTFLSEIAHNCLATDRFLGRQIDRGKFQYIPRPGLCRFYRARGKFDDGVGRQTGR